MRRRSTTVHVGINGGGPWGEPNWSNPLGANSFNANGALIGGTADTSWQMGQTVFGVEGDVYWSSIKGSGSDHLHRGSCETKNSWLGTFRGRIATRSIACCHT
jgi:hypothetical protein